MRILGQPCEFYLAGSILDSVQLWIVQPHKTAETLGQALPEKSAFFVSYVLLKAGLFPLKLLRLGDLGRFYAHTLYCGCMRRPVTGRTVRAVPGAVKRP